MAEFKAKPLFMWAGGKSKVIRRLGDFYFPVRPIKSYCEPFLGGGAMFIEVYNRGHLKEAILGDSYPGIMNVYRQIKDNTGEFIRVMDELQSRYMALDHKGRKAMYYEIREAHAWEYEALGEIKEAAYHYFLQRTGFNGVLQFNKNTNARFGTPAGLLNQKKSVYCSENVRVWSNMLRSAVLHCGDYAEIDRTRFDFVYLDPPYRGSTVSYGKAWSDDEHQRLVDWVFSRKGSWVALCNRTTEDDLFYYERKDYLNAVVFPNRYTAGRKKKTEDGSYESYQAGEIIIYGEIAK